MKQRKLVDIDLLVHDEHSIITVMICISSKHKLSERNRVKGCFKMNNVNAWEENGKFYLSDGLIVIETSELVDISLLVYNERNGWNYNGAQLNDITICEV